MGMRKTVAFSIIINKRMRNGAVTKERIGLRIRHGNHKRCKTKAKENL